MRSLSVLLLSTVLAGTGCSRSPAAPAATAAVPGPAGPTFIHDDLVKATAMALADKKLLFVDAWAPWCHTCLSMQREVLDTPEFGAFADRVVFVAIDTDRPANAAFLAAHPVSLWPTFFVLDPATPAGLPLAKHPGSLSLPAMLTFVGDAVAAGPGRRQLPPLPQNIPGETAIAAAHAAQTRGDVEAAVAAFDTAVAALGPDHPRRGDVLIEAAWARTKSADAAGCVAFITAHDAEVAARGLGGAAFDLQGALLSCVDKLPDPAAQQRLREGARTRLQALLASPPRGAAVDDRADAMATLADLEHTLGAPAAAVAAIHVDRLKLLESDANSATTEKGAQVHDYARMNSLLALGRGDEAVTLLQARAKAIPDDYEPRARLASALFRLKRLDEATVAVDDAIRLSYGPRRLRYLSLKADIEGARGDVAASRAALQRIVDDGAALDAAMKAGGIVATATERLKALDSAPVAAH